jgi:hypothetical protein
MGVIPQFLGAGCANARSFTSRQRNPGGEFGGIEEEINPQARLDRVNA